MSITIKLPVIIDPKAKATLGTDIKNLADELSKSASVSLGTTQKAAKANKDFAQGLDEISVSAQRTGDTIGKLVGKVALWAVATTLIYAPVKAFKDALKELKAVDDELVVVRKVTKATTDELGAIQKRAFEVGSKYGISAADYLSSVAQFARAGYGDLATELGELSVKTQLVGDTTAAVADQFLLAVDAAYKYEGAVDKLQAVLDGANEIDNNYATSIEKIAEGLGIVAPVAAQVKVSVGELTAAIGTITAVTQRSGSEAARALRALMLNIVGDTKTEIDEGVTWTTGEIAGLREVLNLYAADVVKAADATGEVINPMKAIGALAKSMQEGVLTEQKLIGMVSDIGGKLRSSQLLALIQNWGMYTEMVETFEDSMGSADEEVENALDSWTRKSEILKNTWTELVASFKVSDFAKGLLDFATKAIENFNGFTAAGLALVAVIALARKGYLAAVSSVKSFVLATTESTIVEETNVLVKERAVATINKKAVAQMLDAENTKKWTVAQIEAAFAAGLLNKEQITQIVSLGKLTAAEGAAIVATTGLKGAWESLGAAIKANPIGLILTVLSVVIVGVGAAIKHAEERFEKLTEKANEAKDTYKKTVQELEAVETRLREIAAIDKSITDPNDLKRLKDESAELTVQLRLLTEKARIENKEALEALYEASRHDKVLWNDHQISDWYNLIPFAGLFTNLHNIFDPLSRGVGVFRSINDYQKLGKKDNLTDRQKERQQETREELVNQAVALQEYINKAAELGDTNSEQVKQWQALYKIITDLIYPEGQLTDAVEDNTEAVENNAAAVERATEAWGALKDIMSDYLSDYKDSIDRQKDAIDRQIDALKAARETEDEQLRIEKEKLAVLEAQQDLLNAQNQRTVRQYNALSGQWEWVADENNIRTAQEAFANAQKRLKDLEADIIYNREIDALQARKDRLDARYDALEAEWDKILKSLEAPARDISEVLYEIATNGTPEMKAQVEAITVLLGQLGIKIGKAVDIGTGAHDDNGEPSGANGHGIPYSKAFLPNPKSPFAYKQLDGETFIGFDNGGIARKKGLLAKATESDEVVLSPDMANKILSPTSNAQFTTFVDKLGLLFGISKSMPFSPTVSRANESTVYNSGGNVYIAGVKVGSDMLHRPFSEVISTLSLHTNET